MKIETGKYYRTRDGQKVGPMRFDPEFLARPFDVDSTEYPHPDPIGRALWADDGRSDEGANLDLIAEWTDPASGAVKPERYWPWAYVSVEAMNGEGETMYVRAAPSDGMVALDEYAYLDPDQARALAHALIAYAEQAEASK